MPVHHVHLEEAFDAIETFEDEFVSRVELDTRLSINTLSAQFSTKLALGLGPVTPRFPRSANLAL